MDSQPAARQDLSNSPLRLFAYPAVAWIDLRLAARAFGHLSVHCAAHVDDSDARRGRQQASSHRRAKRVFDFAQVADDANLEITGCGLRFVEFREWLDRLIDDSHFGLK